MGISKLFISSKNTRHVSGQHIGEDNFKLSLNMFRWEEERGDVEMWRITPELGHASPLFSELENCQLSGWDGQ
jgi:hypothetical protein